MNKKTLSYAEHYAALEGIANKVSMGLEGSDIDELLPLMEQANTHYNAMKDRIDTVEKLLGLNAQDAEEA